MKSHYLIKSPRVFALILAVLFIQPAMAIDFSTGVFKFQKKLAKNGNVLAQYQLGNMYADGRGTQQDLVAAREWYTKAAEQDSRPAENRLVYLDIVEKGYDKTRHKDWLKQLHVSANNDAEAAMLLGGMYKKGFVVNRNLKLARNYYMRAVTQDLALAEVELESIDEMLAAEKNQRQAKEAKKQQVQKLKQQEKARKLKAQKLKQQEKVRKLKAQQQKHERARLAEQRRVAQEKQRLVQQNKKAEKAAKKALTKEASITKPSAKPEECDSHWAKHMKACNL
jgi:Sel1 repeat-containing protein